MIEGYVNDESMLLEKLVHKELLLLAQIILSEANAQ